MATREPEGDARQIFHLACDCEELFLKHYADPSLPRSEFQTRVEQQYERFDLWASYLGVFASQNISLDKRLEQSDEINGLVIQLLKLIRLNLEFIASQHISVLHPDSSHPAVKLQLQGTSSEALNAVEATLTRLHKLGSLIRRHSTATLDSRVRAFAEKHGDNDYTDLARQIVHFKYRTAPPSLKEQLATSMSARRQRLRYIRRHQEKLAGRPLGTEDDRAVWSKRRKNFSPALQIIDEATPTEIPSSGPTRKSAFIPMVTNLRRHEAHSETTASSFNPTPSVIAKMRKIGGTSILSSSKKTRTIMAKDLVDYPDPPKRDLGRADPTCSFCCRPLQGTDLRDENWRRHVNQDLKPYICISENCREPQLAFEKFEAWAEHMRAVHGENWTRTVHKPITWRCDVDHPKDVPVFTCVDEHEFEEHLDKYHGHCSQSTRKAIFKTSRIMRRRGPADCPICGYDVSSLGAQEPSTGLSQDSVGVSTRDPAVLLKHIASHLCRLAFYGTNDLDPRSGEVSSLASTETGNLKDQEGSKPHPPSGLKDLSQGPLDFDDFPALKQGHHIVGLELNEDGAFADLSHIESPPELSLEHMPNWLKLSQDLRDRTMSRRVDEIDTGHYLKFSDPILQHLYEQQQLWMENLPFVPGASFDSYENNHQDFCHPGTRADILLEIEKWATLPEEKCIFWLNAIAGTGKSTIARTVARTFQRKEQLGASFFFKKAEGGRVNARRLFPTLCRDLALRFPEVRSSVQKQVSADPRIAEKSLEHQFDKLLLQPLLSLRPAQRMQTAIIVIDALDECEHDDEIRVILHLLPRLQEPVFVNVKIFLASRPEFPISLGFLQMSSDHYRQLDLHRIPRGIIEHDLSLFLHDRFSHIRKNHLSLPLEWPGEANVQSLVKHSAPLFIYTTTLCRILEDPACDPVSCLNEVLADKTEPPIDAIYLRMLNTLLDNQQDLPPGARDALIREFREILGTIVILRSPLSITSLSKLLNTSERQVNVRLNSLRSLIQIPEDKQMPVRLLHLSFRDFLLYSESAPRGKDSIWVDERHAHQTLATQCLRICATMLHRDICRLLPSHSARRFDIDSETIDSSFPPELQYACRFWAAHLILAKGDYSLLLEVTSFLKEHFMHWLESMSILGLIPEVLGAISLLQSKLDASVDISDEICQFLEDAKRFVMINKQLADAMPLQLYCSALIFAPNKSIIKGLFKKEIPEWADVLPAVQEMWGAEIQTLEGHFGSVLSVAFSPNGELASTSVDQTIAFWDLNTGASRLTLYGHTNWVYSVAFSLDGQRLASGSKDSTVKLWDPLSGVCRQTLEGHSEGVHSVAFSPDSTLLASGSQDSTVKLWDPKTGALKMTLHGHMSLVHSVAFSPNGKVLVSGSQDRTLKVWDFTAGTCERTLEGHSHGVHSVAFAPYGQLLASGSQDSTVRIWDTTTGQPMQTFKGHDSWVHSVALSPSGRLLASGSENRTVKIWDIGNGTCEQTLEGHLNWVQSVAFSPGGQLLASGSRDGTIKLWDPNIDASQQNIDCHASAVHLVTFSPDDRLVASSSVDKTVKIWRSDTGSLLETLYVHDAISHLEFSKTDSSLITDVGSFKLQTWYGEWYDKWFLAPPPISDGTVKVEGEWVILRGEKVLWLPLEYRPTTWAISGLNLAMGFASGRVAIMRFSP